MRTIRYYTILIIWQALTNTGDYSKVADLGKIKYNTLIINGASFLADYIPNLNSYRRLVDYNKNTPPKVM